MSIRAKLLNDLHVFTHETNELLMPQAILLGCQLSSRKESLRHVVSYSVSVTWSCVTCQIYMRNMRTTPNELNFILNIIEPVNLCDWMNSLQAI